MVTGSMVLSFQEILRSGRVRRGGEFPPSQGVFVRKPRLAFWQPFDGPPASSPPFRAKGFEGPLEPDGDHSKKAAAH